MTNYPKPTWKPMKVESPASVGERMCEYTDRKRAFVVFRFGTVVFSDSNQERSDVDYFATLRASVMQSPDFRVIPMQDGNLLVRFVGPVTGFVDVSFFSVHESDILSGIKEGGLLPGEHLMTSMGHTDVQNHYFSGIYARAKLFRDVEEGEIVLRYLPS